MARGVVVIPRVGAAKRRARRNGHGLMATSKHLDPEPRQDVAGDGGNGPRARGTRTGAALVPIQEKVLAEIGHELGNFFHKLYYWSDFLQESPGRTSADATAVQMLERTIRNLEEFLKVSFEYFHPTQLACMRMGTAELVDAVLVQLRTQLNGTPVTVADGGDWRDGGVMVDPSRFSQALGVAVRHLVDRLGAESALAIAFRRASRDGHPGLEVDFQLSRPSEAPALLQTGAAGMAWAVAEKIFRLHGGELLESTIGPDDKSVTLFLPLDPS